MLSGIKIKQMIEEQKIIFNHQEDKKTYYGPNSIDMRLGQTIVEVVPNFELDGIFVENTRLPSKVIDTKIHECGAYLLYPGRLYLGHTLETIGSDLFAPILHGRSTSARHGLMVHFAGFCDAGWYGQIVLEIKNMLDYPLLIWPGDRVCQMQFDSIDGEVDLYDSHYQWQKGIVPGKGIGDIQFI